MKLETPLGTYFRNSRERTPHLFGIETRSEPVPVGCSSYGPEMLTTLTNDQHGHASATHALAAEMYGVRYGQVRPVLQLRHMNLSGVRVVHTFWAAR